jgi:hypothetical protein
MIEIVFQSHQQNLRKMTNYFSANVDEERNENVFLQQAFLNIYFIVYKTKF